MLITNATVVTWGEPNQIFSDHAIYIEQGKIAAIGRSQDLIALYPQAQRVDAKGQLVMPGNICAHTHFYGAYARGMAIPGAAPENFPQILQRLWWPLDKALDRETVRASTLVSLADAVKHGTTTLIDHHASPNFIEGSLDVIADAVEEAGLRAVLCYEVTDRDGEAKMHAGIAENIRFMRSKRSARIGATFGMHASLTLSDVALKACVAAAAADDGFHIHVAEHEADEEDSIQRGGKRVAQRLDAFGIWRDKTIAAHCVHIDEAERKLLQDRGVWITHQPRSNMNNAVGAMAFDRMMAEQMRICIGNDGFTNNMWADWKDAYLLHKVASRDPRKANGSDIIQAAVYNNARLAEQFFTNTTLGQISIGATADLIFVDYHPFTPLHAGNLPWHILFGFESSMVTATIVEGQILMLDRQLLTLNEAEIAREALELAPKVWERYNANVNAL
ncbi:MAG: putative aminohydrolase SsnA [Chloroflexi bacterium]|nr:putative aminohydrolase SsnA [Chloroflexota bacterium]MCC6896410.1 putative aminohydrolase SsnA [Anaerolineae bacterium]